jgi:quercetin 2,3-dioxygenase
VVPQSLLPTPVTADPDPAIPSYDMNAAFMSSQLRESGIHAVGSGGWRGQRDGSSFPVCVVGGLPFGERLLMWWNFVARSAEEITRAREDWAAGRFDPVYGYPGAPLAAPPLPGVPLKPR